MYLKVDTNDKTTQLMDPENTDEFHIEVHGPHDPAHIDEALAGLGRMVGSDFYIGVAQLREIALPMVDEGWETKFRLLLDAAGQEGRLNDDRSYLMATVKDD